MSATPRLGPIATDEHGRARGFPYHDGVLAGVGLGDAAVTLALSAVDGSARLLVLAGDVRVHVGELREGNIVLEVIVLPAAAAATHGELAGLIHERLHLVAGELAPSRLVVWLTCSYGAELVAVCDRALVSEPGWTLAARPRLSVVDGAMP